MFLKSFDSSVWRYFIVSCFGVLITTPDFMRMFFRTFKWLIRKTWNFINSIHWLDRSDRSCDLEILTIQDAAKWAANFFDVHRRSCSRFFKTYNFYFSSVRICLLTADWISQLWRTICWDFEGVCFSLCKSLQKNFGLFLTTQPECPQFYKKSADAADESPVDV